MSESSVRLAQEIVAACDLSRFGTIVDVGGGEGMLLSAILMAMPAARGVLIDLPHVVESPSSGSAAWRIAASLSAAASSSPSQPAATRTSYEWISDYAWFTEGFDTRDLKDAKALLDDLA